MQSSKGDDENTIIQLQALQLTTAIALPMALKTSIDLGLFEIMEKTGPATPSQLATRIAPNSNHHTPMSQMIDRILRLLSSYSVLSCSIVENDDDDKHGIDDDQVVQRLYGLAPLSQYFIQPKDDAQGSLAPMFNMIHDRFMMNVWFNMKDAILEGEIPLAKTYGKNPKEAIEKDERFAPIFIDAMKEYNAIFINKVLNEYKGFEGLNLVVDVGGGNGSILKAIIAKFPNIKGVNFDLPHVVENLPIYPGIDHVPGDMFAGIPSGDAIFMKWVLKNLDDEQCLKVLKNCYKALPEDGKLIVVELVLPDIPNSCIANRCAFQFDVYLTNMNFHGKERTVAEFKKLGKAAGFSGIQAMVQSYNMTLLEFYKIASTNN